MTDPTSAICIIDCGTSYMADLQGIANDCGLPSTVTPLREMTHADFSAFSHIIISGSPTLLSQIDTINHIKQFTVLKDLRVPILGICNGHQVIGLLYGATIKNEKLIHKLETISIIQSDPLFSGIKNESQFQEEHSEFITVPKEFILLARSDSCENEAMKHPHKQIYGVQFHPEVSGAPGKQLLQNFFSMR